MPNPTYQTRLNDLKKEKAFYGILEAIFKLMEQKPRTIILFLRDILVDYCHNALENGTEQPFDVKKLEDWAFKLQNWISEQTPNWNATTTQQEQAEQQWIKLMETTVEGYATVEQKPFTVSEFKKWITESADASDLYPVVTYFICQYYCLDREDKKTKQKNLFGDNTTNEIVFIANFTAFLPLDTNKACTVYQVECATGDFLVDIFLKNEQSQNLYFVGQTHRKDFHILCHLNLILANCRNFDIQLANPYPFLPTYQGKADVIIAPQMPILHPAYWTWDLIAEVLENDRWQHFDEAVWIDKLIDFGHAKTRYLLALPNNLLKHAGNSQILRTAIDNGWVESLCPSRYIETRAYPYLFVANDNTPDIAQLAQEMRKLPNGSAFFENKYGYTGDISAEELAEFEEKVEDVDIPPPFDELGYVYGVEMEHLGQLKRKYHPKELFFFLEDINLMYIILNKQNFGVAYEKITTGTSLLLLNKNKQNKEFYTGITLIGINSITPYAGNLVPIPSDVLPKNYTLHRPFYTYKQEGSTSDFIGEKDQIYTLREVLDYNTTVIKTKLKPIEDIECNKIIVYPGYLDPAKIEDYLVEQKSEMADRKEQIKDIREGKKKSYYYFTESDTMLPIKPFNRYITIDIPKDAIVLAKENETELPPDHTIVYYKEDLKFSFDETTNLQPFLYPLNRQNIVLANERWHRPGMEWKRSSDSLQDWAMLSNNKAFFISKPAVVVSLINVPYSMCLPANAIVSVPEQSLIFTLKPGFDAEFITLLFRQLDWVSEQFDACSLEITKGEETEKYITVDDLLDFKLPIPPLEEQQKIVLEYKARQVEKLGKGISIITKEEKNAIEYDVIAAIAHSFKHKMAYATLSFTKLRYFLKAKAKQHNPISMDEIVGGKGEDAENLADFLKKIDVLFKETVHVFNLIQKMQFRILNLQTVDLYQVLWQLKEKYKSVESNYRIEVDCPTPFAISIDIEYFNEAMQNLITNACKHGFVNANAHYCILFKVSELTTEDQKYARILYANNGKPFPKNFDFDDFVRFAEKAGETQGDGIGGYVINKVILQHDGIFQPLSEQELPPTYTVGFEILLPLTN